MHVGLNLPVFKSNITLQNKKDHSLFKQKLSSAEADSFMKDVVKEVNSSPSPYYAQVKLNEMAVNNLLNNHDSMPNRLFKASLALNGSEYIKSITSVPASPSKISSQTIGTINLYDSKR